VLVCPSAFMQAVCSVLGFFEESAVLHASQSVHSHTKSIHDLHFKVSIFCTQDRCDREPHYPANGVAIPAVGSPPLELPPKTQKVTRPKFDILLGDLDERGCWGPELVARPTPD
jgi:hypothetical protein